MLQLTHAGVSYPAGNMLKRVRSTLFPRKYAEDRAEILRDVTLWLGRGESWALLGGPDAGKSTLLRLLAGYIPVSAGHCSVEGRVAAAIRGEDGLIESDTGEQNLLLACALEGVPEEKLAERRLAVERLAGLGEGFQKQVREYDEGMRARLVISMALAAKPDLLLLGRTLERCGFPYTQRYVTEIRRMVREGMTLLIESGDTELLSRLCESALWLREGRLIRLGHFETVYAAYSYPSGKQGAPPAGSEKEWLRAQTAAFSEPLAPHWDELKARRAASRAEQWPAEAQQALEQAAAAAQRLNTQLTEFARANLAYEEENERLKAAIVAQRTKADAAEQQLRRLLNAVSDLLRVMHAQFRYIGEKKP